MSENSKYSHNTIAFTPAQDETIKQRWAVFETATSIGKELGMSATPVERRAKELGLPQRNMHDKFRTKRTPELAAKFRELWLSGKTYSVIEKEIGIARTILFGWRIELKLPKRSQKTRYGRWTGGPRRKFVDNGPGRRPLKKSAFQTLLESSPREEITVSDEEARRVSAEAICKAADFGIVEKKCVAVEKPASRALYCNAMDEFGNKCTEHRLGKNAFCPEHQGHTPRVTGYRSCQYIDDKAAPEKYFS